MPINIAVLWSALILNANGYKLRPRCGQTVSRNNPYSSISAVMAS